MLFQTAVSRMETYRARYGLRLILHSPGRGDDYEKFRDY